MRVPAPNSAAYEQMKASGQFRQGLNLVTPKGSAVPLQTIIQPPTAPQATNCSCMIAIDNTWSVVPFSWSQGPDYRNDDDSSPLIPLPFTFCFYGQNETGCFINNNGNISFGTSYGAFSATGFPTNQVAMIAPFWADVDTRNVASGLVYYKITPGYMVVRWQTVGYYSQHTDKLNDFQLIITDGSDPILPPGNNVAFCYGDMQWTTGDASSGVGGFGGIPATVGANRGDGVNALQVGTFDQAGTAYDGPFGANDGISWLDNQQFFFNVCNTGSGNNMPPIMQAPQVCDTFQLCVGDTMQLTANFLSPENGQVTTIAVNAPGVTGLNVVSNSSGNPASILAELVGMTSNIGYNTITISGTDNGTPAQTTSGVIVIEVVAGPTAQFSSIDVCPGSPMPFTDQTTPGNPNNGPLQTWTWNFDDPASGANNTSSSQNPSHTYANSGNYDVILTVVDSFGCKDSDTMQVTVFPLPVVNFTSDINSGCSPLCVNFTDQSTVPNSTVNDWVWNFGDGGTGSTATPNYCFENEGLFTVSLTVTSQDGCTSTDSIVGMINVLPGPVANFTLGPQPATITDPTILFTDASTNNPTAWHWDFGDPHSPNNTSTDQHPAHIYGDTGTYCVQLIVTGPNGACQDTLEQCLEISPEVSIWIPNTFTPNGNGNNDIFIPSFSDAFSIREYEMLIFDRWGNLIFKSVDPLIGWDGKVQGMPNLAMMDTYVYSIRAVEKYLGKEFRFIGHVNMIR